MYRHLERYTKRHKNIHTFAHKYFEVAEITIYEFTIIRTRKNYNTNYVTTNTTTLKTTTTLPIKRKHPNLSQVSSVADAGTVDYNFETTLRESPPCFASCSVP